MTPFPLDLGIDEIAVIIHEHSNEYGVGDKITSARVINPYTKSNIRMLEATDIAFIRVMGRRNQPRNDNYKKGTYKKRNNNLQVETPKCVKYV